MKYYLFVFVSTLLLGTPGRPSPALKAKKYLRFESKQGEPSVDKIAWHKKLQQRIGKLPVPLYTLHNSWTQESLAVHGPDDPLIAPERINQFCRCHFTQDPAKLTANLFSQLVLAAQHFDKRRVVIVSAYRSPKYNLMLRKKGRSVARNSQHSLGRAIDFRIPGVSTKRLRNWALRQKLGGVGYYPKSGFIHMDLGRRRQWSGE